MGINDFTFYDLTNRNAASFKEKDAWFEAQDGRTLTFSQIKEKMSYLFQ